MKIQEQIKKLRSEIKKSKSKNQACMTDMCLLKDLEWIAELQKIQTKNA